MAKYTVGRPSQEIRLRNWPAGRVAAMRLMVSRLESALSDSQASQVEQSAARKFNDDIPFILDLVVDSGFRQFKVSFTPPPGLGGAGRGVAPHPDRQLLFYEVQSSATEGFTNPQIVETPQSNFIISGVGLGEQRFFRVRVINTKFEASRFTSTLTATSAQGTIIVTAVDDTTVRLTETIGSDWQSIFTTVYEPSEGKGMINAHLAVGAINQDDPASAVTGGPAHVQFRWLFGVTGDTPKEIPLGARCVMAAIPGSTVTTVGKSAMGYGTHMTPWTQLPGSGTVEWTLEAKKRPGTEWRGGTGAKAVEESDPLVFVRNTQILEILETF
jgi:hypothetical protein